MAVLNPPWVGSVSSTFAPPPWEVEVATPDVAQFLFSTIAIFEFLLLSLGPLRLSQVSLQGK